MATPRPKQFVAARDFRIGATSYRKGDDVTSPAHLGQLAKKGDKFVVDKSRKESPADPAPGEATTLKEA